MKYYIATSLNNIQSHNELRDYLREELDWQLTYDWTTHGSVKNTSTDKLSSVAMAETKAVAEADILIVILPGGIGTHTELGMALAQLKPTFIMTNDPGHFKTGDKTCAFYYHDLVTQVVGNKDTLLSALKEKIPSLELEDITS